MSNQTIARRYAQALHQEAVQAKGVDAVDQAVADVAGTLRGARDLRLLLESPVVAIDKKTAVLHTLFKGKVPALVLNIMDLLLDKHRADLIGAVLDAYLALRDEQRGIVEAQVRTAMPLSAPEADRLQKALEARTGQQVRLKVDVQPDLIGGLVVRLGDQVFDSSVRHQLASLREQFASQTAVSLN